MRRTWSASVIGLSTLTVSGTALPFSTSGGRSSVTRPGRIGAAREAPDRGLGRSPCAAGAPPRRGAARRRGRSRPPGQHAAAIRTLRGHGDPSASLRSRAPAGSRERRRRPRSPPRPGSGGPATPRRRGRDRRGVIGRHDRVRVEHAARPRAAGAAAPRSRASPRRRGPARGCPGSAPRGTGPAWQRRQSPRVRSATMPAPRAGSPGRPVSESGIASPTIVGPQGGATASARPPDRGSGIATSRRRGWRRGRRRGRPHRLTRTRRP